MPSIRERVKPKRLIALLAIIVLGTYAQFVYLDAPSGYDLLTWVVVVPWLLSNAIVDVGEYEWHLPLQFGAYIAIGALQYLDGDWELLAALFVVAGAVGLLGEARDRRGTGV